jgi:hypothetical protein
MRNSGAAVINEIALTISFMGRMGTPYQQRVATSNSLIVDKLVSVLEGTLPNINVHPLPKSNCESY